MAGTRTRRCGHCCGWHWGAALVPLPLNVPLLLQGNALGAAVWRSWLMGEGCDGGAGLFATSLGREMVNAAHSLKNACGVWALARWTV